jgi:hypothetical protein
VTIPAEYMDVINRIRDGLDPIARANFGAIEQYLLAKLLERCGLRDLPEVTGDPVGERASCRMLCDVCGNEYAMHPPDWRVIGYGNVPFLTVLCDGRRVKL